MGIPTVAPQGVGRVRGILPGVSRLGVRLEFEPEIPELKLIAISAPIVRLFGPAGAIWLGNALQARRWSILNCKDDWFWSSKESIEDQTGLTNEQQETARRKLRDANVLEERRGRLERGASLASIWYRVNLRVLRRVVAANDCRETRQTNAEDPGERMPDFPVNDHTTSTASSTATPVANATREPARRTPRVDDPFGLDTPKIEPATFTLANRIIREAGITSKLSCNPSKRAKLVQDAWCALREGRFVAWSKMHTSWLAENDLPTNEIGPFATDAEALAAILPAIQAHKEAVSVESKLAADNVAEFFLTKSGDGWFYSPLWRFLHKGFVSTQPAARAHRREILAHHNGEALLRVLEGRMRRDSNGNPPSEACVLSRAEKALAWLAGRREAVATHYKDPPRELLEEKAFLQSIFRWIDDAQEQVGSSWLPSFDDTIQTERFIRWFHEVFGVNLNLTTPKPVSTRTGPVRSVVHKPRWERDENPLSN